MLLSFHLKLPDNTDVALKPPVTGNALINCMPRVPGSQDDGGEYLTGGWSGGQILKSTQEEEV